MKKIKTINLKIKPAANFTKYSYLENWIKFHVSVSCMCTVVSFENQYKHLTIHLN